MTTNQAYKTIIVDDEPLARIRLRSMLEDYPKKFEIIAEAENGEQAIEKINQLKPELICLDIQMPEINGFDVLKHLHYLPKVIFCTAYDEFALKAFETNCIDYLVKPLTKERFARTIEKMEQLSDKPSDINMDQLIEQFNRQIKKSETSSIPVKVGDRVIFVRLEDVSYFQADEKYISIITKQAKSYILDSSLKKLEEKLPDYFIRVHKSYLINKNLLKEINKYYNNRFVLVLDDYNQSKITSGRSYYQEIKSLLDY
ncbi:LytTR family transcriptional regulator DNA-binding domain-containing protein [Echinicola sp. CAU 1574]|uniref:LytTR family transcriptional regulator DNA-binding domain-containing protein n=1 Tax=Echinicola arenosa TaxID=2774144 RepID=A0ABR9AIL2_9BACT|nr:LytTR family transcriptional regulator DNA-binding domain-containing protein [Echinicola arenosa]MBD8487698.1 LytTR family transcriptional regulator DNA-binding domain-containing protein [Echinicola arenosa]